MTAATVDHYVSTYLNGRGRRGEIDPATVATNRGTLARFAAVCGNKPAGHTSRRDVERWLATIGQLAPGTRRNRYSVVHRFLTWLVEERILRRHPMTGMRPPRVPRSMPRALTQQAVTDTLHACPDSRARCIVILMVQQGLRRVEVSRLEVGDIDFTNRIMRVRGKGSHERALPVLEETVTAVSAYLADQPAAAGPLVRSFTRPNIPIATQEVGRIVGRAMTDAGVKLRARDGVSGHALRHTTATEMLRGGANVRDVQAVLGHRHLAATEVYLPLNVKPLEQAMEGRRYLA